MRYFIQKDDVTKEFDSMRKIGRELLITPYEVKQAIKKGISINGWVIDEIIEIDEEDSFITSLEISRECIDKLQKQNELLKKKLKKQDEMDKNLSKHLTNLCNALAQTIRFINEKNY